MKEKSKFAVLFILKVLAIVFCISAIISFIVSVIYNINNSNDPIGNIIMFIFANLGVTLFYRLVMAAFFFVFAFFVEDWLKSE